MMIRLFRHAIKKGEGFTFRYQGRLYKVLDDYIIYQPDSDTIYYKDTDF